MMAGETIEGIEEHMLERTDPIANLMAILSLDFDANCVAAGNPNPAIPVGRVRIRLEPNGLISIGSYSSMLSPGDRLVVSNRPAFDDRWDFTIHVNGIGNPADQLHLFDDGGRLNFLILNLAGTADQAQCTPLEEVALGSRNPSVLAQVRLLRSTIGIAQGFNCAGVQPFPGVIDGANTLMIENDGALRVAPGGYALHLPSQGSVLTAEFFSNVGTLATRLLAVGTGRSFRDGSDSVGIELNATGLITRMRFDRQRSGVLQTKIC
jgi:hypothetical protein